MAEQPPVEVTSDRATIEDFVTVFQRISRQGQSVFAGGQTEYRDHTPWATATVAGRCNNGVDAYVAGFVREVDQPGAQGSYIFAKMPNADMASESAGDTMIVIQRGSRALLHSLRKQHGLN